MIKIPGTLIFAAKIYGYNDMKTKKAACLHLTVFPKQTTSLFNYKLMSNFEMLTCFCGTDIVISKSLISCKELFCRMQGRFQEKLTEWLQRKLLNRDQILFYYRKSLCFQEKG